MKKELRSPWGCTCHAEEPGAGREGWSGRLGDSFQETILGQEASHRTVITGQEVLRVQQGQWGQG
jgi:hypothetical protein